MYHGGSFQNILFIFQAAMKKDALYPVDGENDPLIEGFPFMGEHPADFSDNGGDPLLRKLPAPGASRKYVGRFSYCTSGIRRINASGRRRKSSKGAACCKKA